MKNKITLILLLFLSFGMAFGSWQDREMRRIDRKIRHTNKCKCLSKTQEIDGASVKFYFTPKKIKLVRMVEKRVVNGATIYTTYFFDKKTSNLISVNQGVTVFYYQPSGYFSVLSSENFTPEEAKANSEKFSSLAKKYISKIE